MTVYLDKDYKCHVEPAEGLTPAEHEFFDGKCVTFIEGHRFVPHGESWTRSDGKVFDGEMISPFKDSQLLWTAQSLYEETLADKERITALEEENVMLTECVLELSEIVYA